MQGNQNRLCGLIMRSNCCCEVEGWGDGVIDTESMQIRSPHENARAAFSDFSTLRPSFKKVRFQALRLQDPCRQSAQTMENMSVYTKEHFCVDGL